MGTCTRSCQLIASSFSPAVVLAPKVGSRRFVASADSGRAIGSRKLRLLQHGRVIPGWYGSSTRCAVELLMTND